MTDEPSWNTAQEQAPKRPERVSHLTETTWTPKPRRLAWGSACVILAAAVGAVVTWLAIQGFTQARDSLIDELPSDLSADYSAEELERVVTIVLGTLISVLALVTLVSLLALRSLVAGRKPAGRVTLTFMTVLGAPVAVLSLVFNSGGPVELWLTGSYIALLLTAVVIAFTPKVSRWLHQDEPRNPIPLTTTAG